MRVIHCLLSEFLNASTASAANSHRTVNPKMESQSLRTASTYVNNLLLSRGLLRGGISIEFASPIKAEGGLDRTMAQILNLVHDLILRRDVMISKV